jgi:hypothetical protein
MVLACITFVEHHDSSPPQSAFTKKVKEEVSQIAMRMLLAGFTCALSLFGAEVQMFPGIDGGNHNNRIIEQMSSPVQAKPDGRNKVLVFTGDTVIPQVVDGAGWRTSFVLHNLDSKTLTFDVYFLNDNGADMDLPLVGYGPGTWMTITLKSGETTILDTPGTARTLQQGWAYINTANGSDRVGGFAVFRSQAQGRPDQEAVVPVVSQFDARFVLMYDNTAGYATSIAVANPDAISTPIDVTIRDLSGAVIKRDTLSLGKFQHRAFSTATTWPDTAGRSGSIEFRVGGGSFGVGVLGLRFHPSGSFTSFHTLTNVDWMLD